MSELRTQEGGIFSNLLNMTGVVEVISTREQAMEGWHVVTALCRLRPGIREVHYVRHVVKPLLLMAATFQQFVVAEPSKVWLTKEVKGLPEAVFAFSVQIAMSDQYTDAVLQEIEKAFHSMPLPELGHQEPTQAAAPLAQAAYPQTAARQEFSSPEEALLHNPISGSNRTMADLPDEVISRPLPGAFHPNRNSPKPIPSKHPELSGQEFVAGAGVYSGPTKYPGRR